MFDSHDNVPEFAEHTTLLGLAEKVGNHFAGRAIHEIYFVLVNLVLDKEISYVDVSGSLPRGLSSVLLHLHGTLVVLVILASRHLVSLCLDEINRPNSLR